MAWSKTRTSVKWQIHTQWVSPHTLLDKRLWKTLWKSFLVSDDFIRLHYLNQASAAKYWPNFSFKISPELQLQDVDQTLCAKSEEKFSFLTIPQQFENIYDSSATSCTFPQVSFGKEKESPFYTQNLQFGFCRSSKRKNLEFCLRGDWLVSYQNVSIPALDT